jgi:formylglycine-generating enzyme required for sulfatase activity
MLLVGLCSVVLGLGLVGQWGEEANAGCKRSCPESQKDSKGCCEVPRGEGAKKSTAVKVAEGAAGGRCYGDGTCREGLECYTSVGLCFANNEELEAYQRGQREKLRQSMKAEHAKSVSRSRSMGAPSGMVGVAAGPFLMGRFDDGPADESPMRTVYLDGFYIDKHEVTVSQYKSCVDAGVCDKPARTHDYLEVYNYGASGRGRHPVNGVSWHQAVAYCKWKGKRLPREAEWEKAARGVDGRAYPWGEGIACNKAQYSDGGGRTQEVGSRSGSVSPYGALYTASHVWEWTADWYGEGYDSNGSRSNPKGPVSGFKRVIRGGCLDFNASGLRAVDRFYDSPGNASYILGFRCARTP